MLQSGINLSQMNRIFDVVIKWVSQVNVSNKVALTFVGSVFGLLSFSTHASGVANTDPILAGVSLSAALVMISLGIFVSVFLYGSFVSLGAFTSKDKCHWFFALSALLLIWFTAQQFGLLSVSPWLFWLPIFLLPLSLGLFSCHFLYLKRHAPMVNKAIVVNGLAAIVLYTIGIFIDGSALFLAILSMVIWVGLSLFGAVKGCFRGERSAVYFCGALGCLCAGALLVVFMRFNALSGFGPGDGMIMLLAWVFYQMLVSFALVDKFTTVAKRNVMSSENMEVLIDKRTTELKAANQDLEKLAVDAQAASDAKNTFLVNMSHEIRTPLTSIIGYADGILQGDIQPSARDNAINIISQNGVHLLNIINDLLDISKIESNQIEIEMKTFDPIALLQGVADSVSEQVQAKSLVLGVNYKLPLPTHMQSDPTRFRQVILNLVNNAIKFTHMGAIEITVNADLDKFSVSVSDTGIGMSQDQIDTMFTAFAQEDLSKSRQYGGIGLGLSIAKSLVTKLGGKIHVTSVQGQGSCFTVDFDLTVPQEAKWLRDQFELDQRLADIKLSHNVVPTIDVPDLSGQVLLAEDHLENQLLFVKLLERMGLSVTAVDNGYKAVQATLEREFDLILLDIQMPEMDGIKAFELIQSTSANVPVVALTANAMPADVELYMNLGFNDHIAKPVNRENFIDTVTKYLNLGQAADVSIEGDEMDDIKAQYITRLVTRVKDIRASQDKNDWEDIGKHAHAIKGSAGMFGFDDLGQAGGKLELAVKNADEDECQRELEQLLNLCDRITVNVV